MGRREGGREGDGDVVLALDSHGGGGSVRVSRGLVVVVKLEVGRGVVGVFAGYIFRLSGGSCGRMEIKLE